MMDKAQNGALQEGGLTNGVSGNMISDREAAVYDRQIRLWGKLFGALSSFAFLLTLL